MIRVENAIRLEVENWQLMCFFAQVSKHCSSVGSADVKLRS
jgi:hypothetical protein